VQSPIDAKKRLLCQILRAATISAKPIGKVNERGLPSLNQAFKCRHVSAQNRFDVFPIFASAQTPASEM
jgi:hypothetical protein